MSSLAVIIARLDEINRAITMYDPVLKKSACDILLARAFPSHTVAAKPDSLPASSSRPRKRSTRGATFASLLRHWIPTKARDQALLAVYFLTRSTDGSGISTRAVTTLLVENGILLKAPTAALLANTTRTPALLSATKAGTSKQARQNFEITAAGELYVKSQLGEDL
ncbi:MAG: hypothetical protein ABW277_23455 [Longimicrobiaceae bacterium]